VISEQGADTLRQLSAEWRDLVKVVNRLIAPAE
jgi:hypothetical protein